MTDHHPITAKERRAAVQARAAEMGVTAAFVDRLVETFYSRIRSHPTLGPIFERRIGEDWDRHLATMKRFWESVALNAGTYSGKPVPAHQKLTEVRAAHFGEWLRLFEQTLADIAPSRSAEIYFMERAERIAQSLQMAMFDRPGELTGLRR